MVEELICPQCGSASREIGERGQALCTGCGAILAAVPEESDPSVRCPRCELCNDPQAQSCKSCGQPLAKYCPRCGTRLELRMRFCDQCGANHAGLSSPDGRCHWCDFQNSADAELCASCGARVITLCPRCSAKTKSGLNYCAACGLDCEELIQDQEDLESTQPNERD